MTLVPLSIIKKPIIINHNWLSWKGNFCYNCNICFWLIWTFEYPQDYGFYSRNHSVDQCTRISWWFHSHLLSFHHWFHNAKLHTLACDWNGFQVNQWNSFTFHNAYHSKFTILIYICSGYCHKQTTKFMRILSARKSVLWSFIYSFKREQSIRLLSLPSEIVSYDGYKDSRATIVLTTIAT